MESFNGKLDDERLGGEIVHTLLDARVLIEDYGVRYTHEQPHSSLGYRTPAEFAATCATRDNRVDRTETKPDLSDPHAASGSRTKVLSSQPVGGCQQVIPILRVREESRRSSGDAPGVQALVAHDYPTIPTRLAMRGRIAEHTCVTPAARLSDRLRRSCR